MNFAAGMDTELWLDDVPEGSLLHENLSEVLGTGTRARDLVKQTLAISRHDKRQVSPVHIDAH